MAVIIERYLSGHSFRSPSRFRQDNPSVFLTVSEDGTVRQHDLRTTHVCRSSCPPPLLDSLGSISLYTLSVSRLQPWLFTVAGTSPYAFLYDRRMVKVARGEWDVGAGGGWRWDDQGGKVQCVRRFGLGPEPEEVGEGEPSSNQQRSGGNGTGVTGGQASGTVDGDTQSEENRREALRRRARRRRAVRHVTAVEMSKDNAEDVGGELCGVAMRDLRLMRCLCFWPCKNNS